MKCFLTSNPLLENEVNPANHFLIELQNSIKKECNAIFVASNPKEFERTDYYLNVTKECFEKSGLSFNQFLALDNRNTNDVEEMIQQADLIVLAGGHVPTQNQFFHEIQLKRHLNSFDGVLIGISAGSMNSAEMVYAHPELEGEAIDENYQRFLKGLGLTQKMILPHYDLIKDDVLDGMRVFEDIAYLDSMGKQFYALVDGSYVMIEDGKEYLCGEAYIIENGAIQQISKKEERVQF